MQFFRSSAKLLQSASSLRPALVTTRNLGGFTSNVSKNPRLLTGTLSHLSSPASITTTTGSSKIASLVLTRNFHVRRTNGWIVGMHTNINNTNKPPTKFPLAPLLHSQMGAISHFSGGVGGGKRPGGSRIAQGVGLLGAGSMLLGKTKYLLGALKLTKLASLGSMLVTVGTYSMFFGLPYAIG